MVRACFRRRYDRDAVTDDVPSLAGSIPPQPAGAPARRSRAALRAVAIVSGAAVALGALGAIAAVEFGTQGKPVRLTVTQVAAKVRPAVVTIRATVFRDGVSEGQGFLFGGGGHVLTSAHVVAHATKITVVNARGVTGSAALVGVDKSLDIAELLTSDRKTAPLVAAAGPVAVGTQVVAVGNAYSALPYTVLQGAVAGTGGQVALKSQTLGDLIETNLVVNPANSGGPIVDMSGHLVGIVVPGDAGRAFAMPPSQFSHQARDWARVDNVVSLVPPMVDKSASSLVLEGVPLGGFVQTKSEAWAGSGVHVVYIRPPTYDYGGAAIDLFMEVEPHDSDARVLFSVSGSKDSGFSEVASSSALGDQAAFLQKIGSGQVAYEVAWRDRNVIVYMYLGSGMPPAPDISLQTLIGLAAEQEGPIAANLADW